jgi:uncharacterized protein (TIGR02284 family)
MAAEDKDLNRDPITNEPGAHPVGTGVGATGGAVAGAAAGTIGGPIGMAVGGIIGAVVGGLAGKAAAEAVNPTAEEEHWRENYTREPYYEQGRSYDDYGPAYRHGVNARLQHEGDWSSAEPKLASEWDNARSGSGLDWQQAQPATRAAWDRVDTLRGGYSGERTGGSSSMGSSGAMGGSSGMGNTGTTLGTGGLTGAGSDPAMAGASDGMRGSLGMGRASDVAVGSDIGSGSSSMGMDQDIGGRSSAGGMGTTGMESGRGVAGGSSMSGSGTMGSGAMGSDTAMVRTNDLTGNLEGGAGSTANQMDSSYLASTGSSTNMDRGSTGMGSTHAGATGTGVGGVAAKMGEAQSAGNMSGDTGDVIDALQDLVECCKDGEYGFRECAEQVKRQDLKSLFLQRADACRQGGEELNQQIRSLGGSTEHSGSAAGALHRGWVSVKAALTTYDDKAVLEECERGEDNALARYRKALKQPLPAQIKQIVERQYQGVQRNHDQIKMLRDQERAAS